MCVYLQLLKLLMPTLTFREKLPDDDRVYGDSDDDDDDEITAQPVVCCRTLSYLKALLTVFNFLMLF